MPMQRKWRVLASFDWSPRPNVIIAFKAGEVRLGLTRACLERAGDRVQEIRDR